MLVPRALALDSRDSLLALGVYVLIARAFLVHKAPIPLSAADMQAYDAALPLSRGALLRALDRLILAGWLQVQKHRGRKAAYTPTWGRSEHPWVMGEPGIGRPRAVRTLRVPCDLLDVCLGRLTPHARHKVLIERYLTSPALTLADVGAYAVGLIGAGRPTAALQRIGLADATGPLTPPSTEALLARISQLPLLGHTATPPALSARGRRRLGVPEGPRGAAAGQPLFYVPPGQIGDMTQPMIAHMIGQTPSDEQASSASGCPKSPPAPAPAFAHGSDREHEDSTTHPARPGAGPAGGGGDQHPDPEPPQQPAEVRTRRRGREPHRPSETPAAAPGPHRPSETPAAAPGPHRPSETPAAAPGPHRPSETPAAAPGPHRPSETPAAAPGPQPPAPTPAAVPNPYRPSETPAAAPGPHRPSETPAAAPGPHRPSETPAAAPGPHRPSETPAAAPGPHRPSETPAAAPGPQPPAPTPSQQLLRSVGVRADVAAGLAARSAEQVARVIAQARGRSGVRDIAGWVVSALRMLPETPVEPPEAERPPSPRPIYYHPGLSDEQRDRWLRRFRAAPSPYEQRAVLRRFVEEHPT